MTGEPADASIRLAPNQGRPRVPVSPRYRLRMSDVESARELLGDLFGRIRGLVEGLADGLTEEVATYRPAPAANSVAWLIWHTARIQDDHLADLAGVDQAWPAWRERFGLPFDDWATGYGQ